MEYINFSILASKTNITDLIMKSKTGKTIFALGTGRCGTVFLYKVFSQEPKVASHHERHLLSDTFHRYVKWNDLPVDHAGFLAIKEEGVLNDLSNHEVSFEASAYMSFTSKLIDFSTKSLYFFDNNTVFESVKIFISRLFIFIVLLHVSIQIPVSCSYLIQRMLYSNF